jgi:hypothetical protein
MGSNAEPMKDVARLIRRQFDGIVVRTQTRQTNGFIEAINGLHGDTLASKPRVRSCSSSPENSTSHGSMSMPDEPHYPLRFQKNLECFISQRVGKHFKSVLGMTPGTLAKQATSTRTF